MPNIRRCCILGCKSTSKDNIALQFFQFPKRENPLYQLWAEACHVSMRRILPLKKPIICSLHFDRTVIGGRRLTSTAVPTLRLAVPDSLVEQEEACMMVELEHSRKASYVEACVYEWLLRVNASGKMRGSITYNIIKEQAQMAKELINAEEFIADKKWLHRFRETHLLDFTRKVHESGILPSGTSQKMEDIIRDMEHMFPPTSSTKGYANIPAGFCDYSYGGIGAEYYDGYDEPQGVDYNQRANASAVEKDSKDFVFENAISFGSGNISIEPPLKKMKTEREMSSPKGYTQIHHLMTKKAKDSKTTNDSPWSNQMKKPTNVSPWSKQNNKTANDLPGSKRTNKTANDSSWSYHTNESEGLDYHQRANASAVGHDSKGFVFDDEISFGSRNISIEPPLKKMKPEKEISSSSRYSPNHYLITNKAKASKTTMDSTWSNRTDKPTNNLSLSKQSNQRLTTYSAALEYLKPLEDFVLEKENYRAIGLITQLESIFKKMQPATTTKMGK